MFKNQDGGSRSEAWEMDSNFRVTISKVQVQVQLEVATGSASGPGTSV